MTGTVTSEIEDGIIDSLGEMTRALKSLRRSREVPGPKQAQQTQFVLERLRDCQAALIRAEESAQSLVSMLGLSPVHGEDTVRGAVREAISRRRILWITYTDVNGAHTEREIEPILLETPLALAYCHLRQGYRRFHLARVGSASLTDEKFAHHEIE